MKDPKQPQGPPPSRASMPPSNPWNRGKPLAAAMNQSQPATAPPPPRPEQPQNRPHMWNNQTQQPPNRPPSRHSHGPPVLVQNAGPQHVNSHRAPHPPQNVHKPAGNTKPIPNRQPKPNPGPPRLPTEPTMPAPIPPRHPNQNLPRQNQQMQPGAPPKNNPWNKAPMENPWSKSRAMQQQNQPRQANMWTNQGANGPKQSSGPSQPPAQVQKIWANNKPQDNWNQAEKPPQRMSQPPRGTQQQQQQKPGPGGAVGISLLGDNPMIQPSRNEKTYSVPTFMKRVDGRGPTPQQLMQQENYRRVQQQQQQMMQQQQNRAAMNPAQAQFMQQQANRQHQMQQMQQSGRHPQMMQQQAQQMRPHMIQGPNGPVMVNRGPQPMLFQHANQQNMIQQQNRPLQPQPPQKIRMGKPPNQPHVQMRQQPQMMMVPNMQTQAMNPQAMNPQMNQQQAAIMQQVMLQQQMIIAQQQAMMQQQQHQQHKPTAKKPEKKKAPTQVKDIDVSNVQEFKPKAMIEAEKKNEELKRAEVGEWPNLPWEDKNGMNPKERYILQCSTMQFRWLSDQLLVGAGEMNASEILSETR